MKPINAEEIVRVFNGWLEEADSLAEREAIECCMKIFPSGKTGCSTTINTRRMGRHERKTSKIQPRNLKTI